ncbi:hypothetical protein [[Flexibacter] sp. ATCC 35208]|uniref:hypothetical protein n=1 Tax=[Flexibacter] sp. ATCC 35208 TaxID=1936242 RepID=UPI00117ED180|nr:hypothetical protein [[Flexibacter] sp. ATCC 35208]
MKRFKKQSSSKANEAVTTWIAQAIVNVQFKWSNWMYKKTSRWNKKEQSLFLYLILLVFGGISGLIMYRTITGKTSKDSAGQHSFAGPMTRPGVKKIHDPGNQSQPDTTAFSRFYHYIDSVGTTPAGKKQLDSFFRARPHFIDSVKEAERIIRRNF